MTDGDDARFDGTAPTPPESPAVEDPDARADREFAELLRTAGAYARRAAAGAWTGIRTAGGMADRKSRAAKLHWRRRKALGTIGEAAYAQGIGLERDMHLRVEAAQKRLEEIAAFAEEAEEAREHARGAKRKALAFKRGAEIKAARKKAELELARAYQDLGGHVESYGGMQVRGVDEALAEADRLEREIEALDAEFGSLWAALRNNRTGFVAVVLLLLVAMAAAWKIVF